MKDYDPPRTREGRGLGRACAGDCLAAGARLRRGPREGSGAEGRVPLPEDDRPDQPRIVVEVDPGSHFLRRVELHDVNGNVSTFTFSAILANTGLKDKLFEFTVPQDAEVINAPTLAVP